jgi:hypothetical protein
VAAGSTHTLGLRADGTVVGTGNNASGQRNVDSWSGIRPGPCPSGAQSARAG